ncbi:NAD(P)H-dependent flavin oxidoreductase [Streptomyces sp. NBC_01465]|uniref:NAD(P)H-dependent flavin oxidoreductase n=1 Tax=Streptomyces sp. NBC_01465 TaxID=2903878 RepID=UPI002E2EE92E|nr:nitronate monooxygenase [Streptomyces sp. NBC_01465]
MTMSTALTELLGVRHPIVLAPMGGSAGGALAAAVSRAGGLGLLGGGYGDRAWLERELPIVAEGTDEPWGVGFLTWAVEAEAVEQALEFGPAAVMLSFGDPGPYADRIRRSGAVLIVQVTDVEEAERAVDAGADVVVAQGSESGGHGARRGRSTLPFVPLVVDLVSPVPVLAAGGIADGRGVAAALALGAAGALIGTRFQASAEALVDPAISRAIVEGRGQDTERNTVLDLARGASWPTDKYAARTLGHPYLDRWRGRETELAGDAEARRAYQDDVARGVIPPLPIWAGEGVDLITDLPPAADLVATLAAQAEEALARAGKQRPGHCYAPRHGETRVGRGSRRAGDAGHRSGDG